MPEAAAVPNFRISDDQSKALLVLEMIEAQIVVAANVTAGPTLKQREAGEALMAAAKALSEAKFKWLALTQKAVTLVSPAELASNVRAAGFAP